MSTFLTTEDVAERWHCQPVAVADAIRAGELLATKPKGRWLITLADVEAYEQARANVTPVAKRTRLPRARRAS